MVRGQGPPALLLHDLYSGATGSEVADLGARLVDAFTVVTPDLPGFGRSGRPPMRYTPDFYFDAIVEFVRHAIDRPTLLVGSGLSAAYSTEAALRLGDLAAGVVLLGPPEPEGPGLIGPSTWRPLAYQMVRSPLGIACHRLSSSRWIQQHALRESLVDTPEDLATRAAALERSARQPNGHWPLWSLWVGDLQWDPRPSLARLGAPALVLWGAESRKNPTAPEAYHAVRPDIEQRVVPRTGRWPHVDDPDQSANLLREWWNARGVVGDDPPSPFR